MENKKIILLLSGGIDSTTLLAKLSNENYQIIAITFSYGQFYNIEIEYAKSNAQKYKVVQHNVVELDNSFFQLSVMPSIQKDENKNYIPFRNMIFIALALNLAESIGVTEVYLACNREDSQYWDCKENFIQKINEIAYLNTNIEIKTPFINVSKSDIIKLAQFLKVDLTQTITCYHPIDGVECGVCQSCIIKQKALRND